MHLPKYGKKKNTQWKQNLVDQQNGMILSEVVFRAMDYKCSEKNHNGGEGPQRQQKIHHVVIFSFKDVAKDESSC